MSNDSEEALGLDGLVEEAQRTVSDVARLAVRAAEEQPLLAVGAAAALGFALGGGFLNRWGGRLVLSGLQAAVIRAARDRLSR